MLHAQLFVETTMRMQIISRKHLASCDIAKSPLFSVMCFAQNFAIITHQILAENVSYLLTRCHFTSKFFECQRYFINFSKYFRDIFKSGFFSPPVPHATFKKKPCNQCKYFLK
jgi:hypothetical protein